jgi:hypothetical protein
LRLLLKMTLSELMTWNLPSPQGYVMAQLRVCQKANMLQDWSDRVMFGNFDAYRERFEQTQQYFAPRFPEATRVGNEMIKTILEKTADRR